MNYEDELDRALEQYENDYGKLDEETKEKIKKGILTLKEVLDIKD